MKAKKSPMILKSFLLLNHKYQFIHTAEKPDVKKIMDDYLIDVDYAMRTDDKGYINIFAKIGVNNIDKPLPGYKLFIEGVCIFSFDDKKQIDQIVKNQLLHASGINICINNLRNILSITTANGPFGRYLLPALDVNHLLSEKRRISKKKK